MSSERKLEDSFGHQDIEDITLEGVFGLKDLNLEKTCSEIESQLTEIINKEIISVYKSNICTIERKGWNLFHPLFGLYDKKHRIISLKLSKINHLHRIRVKDKFPLFNRIKNTILLTDAVNKGNEVTEAIQSLERNGYHVTKVCGYLANKVAILQLEKKFPRIKFVFSNIIDDETKYWEFSRPLNLIYHSHIEPLDNEHPYVIFKVDPEKIYQFNEFIASIIYEYYSEVQQNDDNIPHPQIIGTSYQFNNKEELLAEINPILRDIIVFEYGQIRVKIDFQTSEVRLMSYISLEIHLDQIIAKKKICKIIQRKYCDNHYGIKVLGNLCPACIENNIAKEILKKIEDRITATYGEYIIEKNEYMPVDW